MGPNDSEGGPLPVVTPTDVPLQMTASVPDEPIKITGPFLQIDTQLTNITDSPLELRTARAGADISVVKDGVVLRPPGGKRDANIRFTLAPGKAGFISRRSTWATPTQHHSQRSIRWPPEPMNCMPSNASPRCQRTCWTQDAHSMCTADRGMSRLAGPDQMPTSPRRPRVPQVSPEEPEQPSTTPDHSAHSALRVVSRRRAQAR
jgi:hypothetical protein